MKVQRINVSLFQVALNNDVIFGSRMTIWKSWNFRVNRPLNCYYRCCSSNQKSYHCKENEPLYLYQLHTITTHRCVAHYDTGSIQTPLRIRLKWVPFDSLKCPHQTHFCLVDCFYSSSKITIERWDSDFKWSSHTHLTPYT